MKHWWQARTVAFRKIVRTMALLLVSLVLSLGVGVVTATAASPVGPHHAQWSVTLDSRLALDLGPLGTASLPSPVPVLGVKVVLGEIPSQTQGAAVDATALGRSLSADVTSYLSTVTHPEITIKAAAWALVADAARRAGLVESVILCLVAAGRLATRGRLRAWAKATLRHGYATTIAGVTVAACVFALLVPELTASSDAGTTLSVLSGTAYADAKLSGRLADVAQAYGAKVAALIDDNEQFYSQAQNNLKAAWQASSQVDGLVEVTVADGSVDTQQLAAQASASASAATDSDAVATPTSQNDASPDGSDDSAPAVDTGALAVKKYGAITAVLSTDLHCNLDMIALTGTLDTLAAADVHLDDGDITMTGSEPEKICVDALSDAVPDSVAKAVSIGNHDSDETAQQLQARGWQVTDGSVQTVGGLRILGDVDSERTPAGGTHQRGDETAAQVGARLAQVSCEADADVDVVLIHSPYTFQPLIDSGCAPLLLAGHSHQELGMSVTQGANAVVAQLRSGAGLGGTSIGPITENAYLHVLSFNEAGQLLAWRAVVIHADASVTVGAWRGVGAVGTQQDGAAAVATSSADTSD